jgi:hypothetical protein
MAHKETNMNTTIYINGEARHTTGVASVFFADHPSLQYRYCSQHNIGTSAAHHLRLGGSVRTGGNHYSLRPPMAEHRAEYIDEEAHPIAQKDYDGHPGYRIDPLPAPKPLPMLHVPKATTHREIVAEIDARMRKVGWRLFWFGAAFMALGIALRGVL